MTMLVMHTNIMLNPEANSKDYGKLAYKFLNSGNYSQASKFYEQAIEIEPNIKSHYWYYGLTLLLQNQETEAQMTWMLAMSEGELEEVDVWNQELLEILETAAQQQEQLEIHALAWTIRQYIKEIAPTNIQNLLLILLLSIKINNCHDEDINNLGIIELLQSKSKIVINDSLYSLLFKVLETLLNYYPPLLDYLPKFLEATLSCVQYPEHFINLVIPASFSLTYSAHEPRLAIKLIQVCLNLFPQELELLISLANFYQRLEDHKNVIDNARLCCALAKTLPDKIFSMYLLLRGLLSAGGYWKEALEVFQQYEYLLLSLIRENPRGLNSTLTNRLISANFFFPYLRDQPKLNRNIQNQLMELCQANILIYAQDKYEKYSQHNSLQIRNISYHRKLKIAYISHCFKRHSVGWLARSLFQHHNQEKFDIYGYFLHAQVYNDPLQKWYLNQVTQARKLDGSLEIADQIAADEIDILIDLDSITLNNTCEVMALKPAPIQATWLGLDAAGFSNIDYYIADPYVLPETAQDYYTEKIWRLPQTYIAVDGFEVGVPTLRRDTLNIPTDAVVYYSGQRGFKRHPDTVRLQMQIIQGVPNSYFLIKGFGDEEAVQKIFIDIAEKEGVTRERLIFLDEDAFEETHRANLGIADIVLDTYPYNGATTTLETLWMGIPLVTRVGEQFAARNSYTMMMNAGITEGIAWSDEEYVEWGVRLGKDEKLRQQVSWKLRQSRQTAPLWNGKQFAREMEKAYQQMWELRG